MKQRCPTPDFAGLELRRPSDASLERAHRSTARTHRDRRLAEKLDLLLGAADAEDEESAR